MLSSFGMTNSLSNAEMDKPKIITVTLNPCMDKTVEVAGFVCGKTNRVVESRMDIGGKGVNVSRVLCGCGIPILATGLIAGVYGHKITDTLERMGIPCAFCEAEGETRVNLKILDIPDGTMTELNEKGFCAGSVYAEFSAVLKQFLPDAEVLVLSGSVPPDLPAAVYRDLIALAGSFGVQVILDADGAYLKKGIEAKPYAIKPNLAEFQALTGTKVTQTHEIIAAARQLNDAGIRLVCVSMGERGSVFVRDSVAIHAVPFPVEVGSAAAAGDSMVAALAYATVKGLALADTARLMTAAGTLTAALPGTQVISLETARARAEDVSIQIIE